MHSGNETWSALGRYWLKKAWETHWGRCLFVQMFKYKRVNIESHFRILFECTAIIQNSKFQKFKFTPNSLQNILDTSLFCNENITFRGKSLFFKSFLLSGLRTIRDIWDEEILNFKDSIQIYNSLFDKRNCISEYSQIKAAKPNTFVSILKKSGTLVQK